MAYFQIPRELTIVKHIMTTNTDLSKIKTKRFTSSLNFRPMNSRLQKKQSLSRWFFLQERMYQVLSKTVTHDKDAKQLSPDPFLLWNVPYPVRVGVSLVYINYCYVKIRNFFSNSLHMVERFLMFLIRHLEWFFLFLERTTSQHPSREVRDFTPPRLCKFPALAICGFQNGGEIENTCKSCRSVCECYGRHKSDRKVFAGSL